MNQKCTPDSRPAKATRRRSADALPLSLPPRGLHRFEAAAYIGVSATLFDEMVADGRMPKPKEINARRVWDRHQLDFHFDEISNGQEANPWDEETR